MISRRHDEKIRRIDRYSDQSAWYRKQKYILRLKEKKRRDVKRQQRRSRIMAHRDERQIGQYRKWIDLMMIDPFTDDGATCEVSPNNNASGLDGKAMQV